ncbi:MAG: PqiC family protein [Gammaproteobacteria bacterium]
MPIFAGGARYSYLILCAIAVCGCARSPDIEYFALNPQWSDAATASAATRNIIVEVTIPAVPAYVERDEIVEYLDDQRLKIHEHKRWVADLDKVIRDYFVASLHDKAEQISFVSSATKIANKASFRLDSFFNRFDIYHGDRVEVVVTWQVSDTRGQIAGGINNMQITYPLQGESVDSIVLALDTILNEITNEIVAQLGGTLSFHEQRGQ